MEVVKNSDGFESISGQLPLKRKIVHLEHLMVTVIEFTGGPMDQPDPPHKHHHEQITYVAAGSLKLFIEDRVYLLHEGDIFKIASNLNHSVQTLTETVRLVDSFTPLREDFL